MSHCRRFAVCAQRTLPHTLFTAAHNAHNAHCCTQRAQHTTRTSRSHNNQRAPPRKQCIFQQIQPTGSLNALGQTNQIGGFCEPMAYLVGCRHCSGLAGWGWRLPHSNGRLTKGGELHQTGDNQSRFPRAPSPVAPNPKTALNHKMTRVQQYISLAPIPQEQKTAADILNLGVTVYLQPD